MDGPDPVDVLLGAAAAAVSVTCALTRPLTGLARVAGSFVPRSVPVALAARGAAVRPDADRLLRAVLSPILRRVVDVLVVAVDLTEVAARAIDLDALAARLDVDAVVGRADLDAAVARVDIDAVAARIDIAAILDRVDIDAVAARIDIAAILDRVDIDAVVARVDVDSALARLDLAGISLQVIDAIDLPEILRQSTGTVATEAVRGVRTGGVSADDSVARFVDRVLRRARPEGPALS